MSDIIAFRRYLYTHPELVSEGFETTKVIATR